MTLRAAVAAALAATALAVPSTAGAAPAPSRSVARIYTFDGTGNGVLLVSGTIDPGKGHGLFASVTGEAAKTGAGPDTVFFPEVTDLDGTTPHTFGALGQRDLCADPLTVCSELRGGGLGFSTSFSVSGDGKQTTHLRFAVIARGAKVTFTEQMIGWRAHDLRGVHQVTDDTADGAGVSAAGVTVGASLGATAPAARGGSVAIAVPPCDVAGAGVTLLTGPGSTQAGVCPTDAITATSRAAGTWTLTGAAAGVSTRSTRLLVLDF